MKSLTKYLTEALINESCFKKRDWLNQEHTYAQQVIDRILAGKTIPIASKDGKTIVGEYTPSKEEISQLQNFKPEYTEDSLKDFDEIFRGKLTWKQIFKGEFSGHSAGGSNGQIYESLVCYIFNKGLDNADVQAWAQHFNIEINTRWLKSCQETVKALYKHSYAGYTWDNKTYIACHVDGNDYDFDNKFKFALDITSFFKNKKEAKRILGVDCRDLYSGQKDEWNKADIVLVNKQAVDVIDEMKKVVSDGQSLNNELLVNLANGMIIPISLKIIDDATKAKIEGYNIDEADTMEHNDIDDVLCLKISDKYPKNQWQGTLTLICKSLEDQRDIQFRKSTSGKNNLNVEAKMKLARAGKALANIKKALGLPKNNDYYIVKNTNEEAIKSLKKYGVEIVVKNKSNYDKVKPEFRERACVAGMLGLLDAYQKQKHPKIDHDFMIDFANFCWLCATQGSGAFFKLYQ